ncbi:MAG: CRISPR-associated protein Cas4 [Nitrososphaerales archaeon]
MKASGSDGKFLIDVWDITQYYYCPRKLYFLRTLKVPVTLKRKMEEGKEEHLKEIKRMKERKDIFSLPKSEVKGIHYKLQLESEELGLAGQVDLVLELSNGDMVPVEIKYSDYMETFIGRKKQLIAYAILLEENFKRSVKQGILYYPVQNKHIILDISYEEKKNLIKDIKRIRESIISERIPRRVDSSKCGYCEVARYCL